MAERVDRLPRIRHRTAGEEPGRLLQLEVGCSVLRTGQAEHASVRLAGGQ